jgi:hypothetical protein
MKLWMGLLAAGCLTVVYAGVRVKKTTVVNGTPWFNSLADAEAQAKESGKPILLLSMFGHIDEEMPCANARTLRATLFKDPRFKELAENEVIPAWEMVREVPKVEIDFGDGRKMVRTVRGNACMYLCTPQGKVIDAYPGVYTADDFVPMIDQALRHLPSLDDAGVIAWHRHLSHPPTFPVAMTVSKMAVESPALNLIGAPQIGGANPPSQATDPQRAMFESAAAMMSDSSLTPHTPDDISKLALGQPLGDKDPATVGNMILQRDSKLNVTDVRNVVHLWLASEKALPDTLQARDTVLERILKIPYKDPYFGLNQIQVPGTPTGQ